MRSESRMPRRPPDAAATAGCRGGVLQFARRWGNVFELLQDMSVLAKTVFVTLAVLNLLGWHAEKMVTCSPIDVGVRTLPAKSADGITLDQQVGDHLVSTFCQPSPPGGSIIPFFVGLAVANMLFFGAAIVIRHGADGGLCAGQQPRGRCAILLLSPSRLRLLAILIGLSSLAFTLVKVGVLLSLSMQTNMQIRFTCGAGSAPPDGHGSLIGDQCQKKGANFNSTTGPKGTERFPCWIPFDCNRSCKQELPADVYYLTPAYFLTTLYVAFLCHEIWEAAATRERGVRARERFSFLLLRDLSALAKYLVAASSLVVSMSSSSNWVTCAPTTVSIGGEDVVVSGAATRSMCQVSVSLTGYTFGVIYLTSVVALLFFILSIGSLGRRVRLCGAYVARHPTPTEHSVTVPLLAAGSWPGTASAGKRREGEDGVHSSEQGESPQKGGSSFVPAGSRAFAALLVGTLMLGTVMIQFGMLLASGGTKPHFVCAVTGNATLPGAGQYFSLNAEGICDDVVRPLTAKDVLQGGSHNALMLEYGPQRQDAAGIVGTVDCGRKCSTRVPPLVLNLALVEVMTLVYFVGLVVRFLRG